MKLICGMFLKPYYVTTNSISLFSNFFDLILILYIFTISISSINESHHLLINYFIF